MNKQELIEKYEYELKLLRLQFGEIFRTKVYEELLDYLKQLDEPQKVVVSQFVADYIEYAKDMGWDLLEAMKDVAYEDNDELRKWFYVGCNVEIFARAWLNGYTVEEKRYRVRIKGVYYNGCLIFDKINKKWFLSSIFEIDHQMGSHTRKELEQAGFGWVFDCPGVEIEEAE